VLGHPEVEVGYAIVPERWGEGLATEAAAAAVDIAFKRLDLDALVAFTLTTNAASRRVLEKVAFAYDQDFEHVGLPHALYRRHRQPT
jgi:ribosomal-protein-alanine N-acetyltransferase